MLMLQAAAPHLSALRALPQVPRRHARERMSLQSLSLSMLRTTAQELWDAELSAKIDKEMKGPASKRRRESESQHTVHEVEMSLHTPRQQEQQRHRNFLQYKTSDGKIYFVDVETQVSVWELPSDGVVVGGSR